jgi:hypothetical protein
MTFYLKEPVPDPDPDPDPLVRGTDPYQTGTDPEHWKIHLFYMKTYIKKIEPSEFDKR